MIALGAGADCNLSKFRRLLWYLVYLIATTFCFMLISISILREASLLEAMYLVLETSEKVALTMIMSE